MSLFNIISTEKSGSGLLSYGLGNIPSVVCHERIFQENIINLNSNYEGLIPKWVMAHRNTQPGLFVDYLNTYPYVSKDHKGYRVLSTDLPLGLSTSLTNSTKKVLFKRKNKLDRYLAKLFQDNISYLQISEGTERSLPDFQFNINPSAMLADFEADDEFYSDAIDTIEGAEQQYILVSLEDYLSEEDGPTIKQSILDFLGIVSGSIGTVFSPLYPVKPYQDLIQNYDVIKTAIEGSEWAGDIPLP